jgi:hypothetical protein
VSDHWWVEAVRAFATSEAGPALVRTSAISDWADRFAAALGQSPPLTGPGVPVLEPAKAALGEATARELAAEMADAATVPAPAWPGAGAASDEALRRGERGHRALERMPLSPPGEHDLATWLAGPGGLDRAEALALTPYVEREILPALGSASTVAREHPFRLHAPNGGIVTGAIDVLWQDPAGAWWVGDYKFAEADPASGERHAAQLAIYALAAATVLGLEEVRGRLWYVDEGRGRDLHWDAAALAAIERRLEDAFTRLPMEPVETPYLEDGE